MHSALVREREPLAEGDGLLSGVCHSNAVSGVESLHLRDSICVEIDDVGQKPPLGAATSANAPITSMVSRCRSRDSLCGLTRIAGFVLSALLTGR